MRRRARSQRQDPAARTWPITAVLLIMLASAAGGARDLRLHRQSLRFKLNRDTHAVLYGRDRALQEADRARCPRLTNRRDRRRPLRLEIRRTLGEREVAELPRHGCRGRCCWRLAAQAGAKENCATWKEARSLGLVARARPNVGSFRRGTGRRSAIAWQNVAYNQPPHPSFYLDEAAPLAEAGDPLHAD